MHCNQALLLCILLTVAGEALSGYLGCFKDSGSCRDLPERVYNGSHNKLVECMQRCGKSGYRYAGVQASNECWCGNSYGKHGRASHCNMRCSGEVNFFCGGVSANSVYDSAKCIVQSLGANSARDFQLVNGSLSISDTISSEVLNETNVRFEIECMARCEMRGCAVAVAHESRRTCQMVIINDESSGQLGPNGSHVMRELRSNDGARVWKAKDFDLQMQTRLAKHAKHELAFNNTSTGRIGSIQKISINVTGCYRIEACGARGGSTTGKPKPPGNGACAAGNFSLTAGTQLTIVVGQKGGDSACGYGAGGGGGSFVYRASDSFLYLAAGGGGGATYDLAGMNGSSESKGTTSYPFNTGHTGTGGSSGAPGIVPASRTDSAAGGAGAGWNGSAISKTAAYPSDGTGGSSRSDGWFGGSRGNGGHGTGDGGFGGGGGGGDGGSCQGASGGGGGYSGGGAATYYPYSGGGGGSFCAGSGCVATTGGNSGDHGRVIILHKPDLGKATCP